jgi:hypothetical protein
MHFALQKAKARNAIKSLITGLLDGAFVIKQMILLSHYEGLM